MRDDWQKGSKGWRFQPLFASSLYYMVEYLSPRLRSGNLTDVWIVFLTSVYSLLFSLTPNSRFFLLQILFLFPESVYLFKTNFTTVAISWLFLFQWRWLECEHEQSSKESCSSLLLFQDDGRMMRTKVWTLISWQFDQPNTCQESTWSYLHNFIKHIQTFSNV